MSAAMERARHHDLLSQQAARKIEAYKGSAPPKPPDPHADLADPNSPTFNPLEYKRLTGSLPRVALEAARKINLIED